MPESSGRKPFVAGNWKMNDPGAVGYVEQLLALLSKQGLDSGNRDIWVCPPATALARAAATAHGSGVAIAAQNMCEAESGAFTGEISASMLVDLGVAGAILGHSERRQLFCETDERLRAKLPAALAAGLVPILCVGETESEREAGETEDKLRLQLTADLADVDDELVPQVVIAYEPIWAIGTGKTATPEQAQETVAFVRSLLAERGGDAAERVRILYGGSVKAANAKELLSQPDVDGALVGGASLDPAEFAKIAAAA